MSSSESNVIVIFSPKAVYDVLDYTFDYTRWLNQYSDTITTSNWLVPDGLTINQSLVDDTNKKATVWLSGGIAGTVIVTNEIITANGRQKALSFKMTIVP